MLLIGPKAEASTSAPIIVEDVTKLTAPPKRIVISNIAVKPDDTLQSLNILGGGDVDFMIETARQGLQIRPLFASENVIHRERDFRNVFARFREFRGADYLVANFLYDCWRFSVIFQSIEQSDLHADRSILQVEKFDCRRRSDRVSGVLVDDDEDACPLRIHHGLSVGLGCVSCFFSSAAAFLASTRLSRMSLSCIPNSTN